MDQPNETMESSAGQANELLQQNNAWKEKNRDGGAAYKLKET